MKYGMEGIGIYWCLIEILWENDGYYPTSKINIIAFELRTESERIADIVKSFELFKIKDGNFYSESLLFRMELRDEKSKKASESAKKRWLDAKAMRTQCEGNAIKEIKEKEITIQESKIKEEKPPEDEPPVSEPDFIEILLDDFCNEYYLSRETHFDLTSKYKERSAIGKLLTMYRKKNPNSDTETARMQFNEIFKKCLGIKENFYYNGMSPSLILSQWNALKIILNGKKSDKFDTKWLSDIIAGSKANN